MKKYDIIFAWRGERHRCLTTFIDLHEAELALSEFKKAGWKAWIEEV